ncbi:MAG TPA: beta-phosphoglucomutase family hydrolase [Nitrospira sp.]|nr:beta-phosphoglucomutase family hydrolase [Nitrospira sp.]
MNGSPSERASAATRESDRLNFETYDAVLSDLDGVITQTARLHAAAWKRLFDDYLCHVAAQTGTACQPFDLEEDYRLHLDGKPRQDGVRDFLQSRGLTLPLGSPSDSGDRDTLYGMGNRKDGYFEAALRETGVAVYPTTVAFLRVAKQAGLKMAVVSSSHHCAEIIEAIGLTPLFEVRIDGHEIDRLRLPGKPAPDAFVEAARRLTVEPRRAIVIEDALSGVRAGRAGGFGLVIGVNRRNQAQALRDLGADVVVNDLGELLPGSTESPTPASR